jgi:hypothetical protein
MTINVTFKKDKETTNKIRFSGEITDRISGSIYLLKTDAGDRTEIKFPVSIVEAPVAAAVA